MVQCVRRSGCDKVTFDFQKNPFESSFLKTWTNPPPASRVTASQVIAGQSTPITIDTLTQSIYNNRIYTLRHPPYDSSMRCTRSVPTLENQP